MGFGITIFLRVEFSDGDVRGEAVFLLFNISYYDVLNKFPSISSCSLTRRRPLIGIVDIVSRTHERRY